MILHFDGVYSRVYTCVCDAHYMFIIDEHYICIVNIYIYIYIYTYIHVTLCKYVKTWKTI